MLGWAPGARVCAGFRLAAGLPVAVPAGEERDVATATSLCVSVSGPLPAPCSPEVRAGPGDSFHARWTWNMRS